MIEKVNIDFQVVDTKDPRYLMVADTSSWGGIEGKNAIIEIVVPGVQDPITHYFDKRSINRYNSRMLGLTCITCEDYEDVDIPDGIYEITVKGSPDKYFKKRIFLKTTNAELELDKLLIKNITECTDFKDSFVKKLFEIDTLIRAAKANVRYGNECKGSELFQRANKLIERLKGCKQ